MPVVDEVDVAGLAADVARFHVTDRALRRAQRRIARVLERGAPDDREARAYVKAVRTYFTAFSREAAARLADVERRLARASQLQYNLAAERGVAAARVEATGAVLARLAELGP